MTTIKKADQIEKMKTVSERFKETPIAKALIESGKGLFIDKVLANFYFACKKNEDKLEQLNLNSVLEALTKCCQYELIPDAINACLIFRWDKEAKKFNMNFQPMYQGLLETLYKTGFVKMVSAEVVYDVDEFDYNQGSEPFIKHKINITTERKKKLCAYVNIELLNGGRIVRVVPISDINRIKARAQTQMVWNSDFDEMAVKTALKRGYKQCPKSEKLSELISYDNSLDYDFDSENESQAEKKTQGIKNIIGLPEPKKGIEIPKPEQVEDLVIVDSEDQMEVEHGEYL